MIRGIQQGLPRQQAFTFFNFSKFSQKSSLNTGVFKDKCYYNIITTENVSFYPRPWNYDSNKART
jgi:hypothetical protein